MSAKADTKRIAEGVGLGLRHDLAEAMFERDPAEIGWVEIHPENYVARGGTFADNLERALERWAILPHGLSLCVGTTTRYEASYVRQLRGLLDKIDAPFYSDHLCFGGIDGTYLHDLLPLPFTKESVRNVAERVAELQDGIGRPVAVENISYYADPSMPEHGWAEPDFLLEVLDAADCKLLLDVNNIYVNALNHRFDPRPYIDRIPAERVVQIHVAGHLTKKDGQIIDTHGEPICEGVYDLLDYTLERIGPTPVLLERDGNFPPLEELLGELSRLRTIYDRATAAHAASRAPAPASEARP